MVEPRIARPWIPPRLRFQALGCGGAHLKLFDDSDADLPLPFKTGSQMAYSMSMLLNGFLISAVGTPLKLRHMLKEVTAKLADRVSDDCARYRKSL
jgi:hypothetical protein